MIFRTEIEINKAFDINHKAKLLMMGSCFVENIGSYLKASKFDADINPFGVLYNPQSIANSLHLALNSTTITEDDIFFHEGLFHSFLYHSSYSHPDKDQFLNNINASLSALREKIATYNVLIITLGTSYVYSQKATGITVSNCHKIPANKFERNILSVENIVDEWQKLITCLRAINPNLKIVFTVSPIRHWKDGAHQNQISKAILLVAINEIISRTDNSVYFPSYEIVLDDLRDYRFYEEDMIHPNKTAIKYIWEKFGDMFFCKETLQINKEWEKLNKAINHRAFNENLPDYQLFLKQTLLKLEQFSSKYPYIYCENEIGLLKNKIEY